jgi:hypothetical protein
MAAISTQTVKAQAQAKAIKAALKPLGLQYAAMYSNATKQGIRIKLYALRPLTALQRDELCRLGFSTIEAKHWQAYPVHSVVGYYTGAPVQPGTIRTTPAQRAKAKPIPKAKAWARAACVCPHCGGVLSIAKG